MPYIVKIICVSLLVGVFIPFANAEGKEDIWQKFKDGQVVAIMRHALAPGTGDPDQFRLEDCSTQRNLSERGRSQSQKIGMLFKSQGIDQAHVFTSQWCRCRDTARLLNLGEVVELPLLNSFFGNFSRKDLQTQALQNWLMAERPMDGPVLLVTHQVNITGYLDVFPQSGEIIFFEPNENAVPVILKRLQTLN